MTKTKIVIIILLCFAARNGFAQTCNALGQNPGSAFPVCGTATFSIASVPICGNRQVPGPCTAVPLTDKNPFWYKFTCFTPGTLGFVITPNTLSDDYDWQIFDITNHNPDEVYTNASLFVACNWSGEGGLTGASSAGLGLAFCDGYGVPTFSSMPNLTVGHEYILLVSHFSDSQSGYALSFGGGTAVITDPVNPSLMKARAACDGTKISIKLNKKMKCSSLAADGSDFMITPAIAPIISAAGIDCSNGFDMDSVVISLGGPLPAGNYTVQIKTGTDGNNLLDNCGRSIPDGQSLPVTVFPLVETPMDSLSKVGCAPNILYLVFKDPIKCSSIAANGSDFIVTGNTTVTIAAASGTCNGNDLTNTIQVKLSAPIQTAGSFKIQLVTGSDGNTIINECGKETTGGAALLFNTKDTVSAAFKADIHYGCVTDTILYTHNGNNGVNTWHWNFDNSINSSTKDNIITYPVFGQKQATLIVSNGTCSDTVTTTLFLDNAINALFESTSIICPEDPAIFVDKSTGSLNNAWFWNFGNGNTSTQQNPPNQLYPSYTIIHDVLVQLIITNSIGCTDTATNTIRVAGNCYIAIPKAFTPNGDGLNDYLYPTNAYKAKDLLFAVYNRLGQKIFETRDWTNKWDGTFKGNPQDTGTYVWLLNYTNIDTGQKVQLKGSTVLIR